jgi:endonuclease YncB( thermonuclease family)
VQIHGVQVPQPPPAVYIEILTRRIPTADIELHCELSADPDDPARYTYLAWLDKTGPVWRDLAELLIGQGAAKVAPSSFPEREQYLAAETKARSEHRGHWAR